jgi:hypothetical protein
MKHLLKPLNLIIGCFLLFFILGLYTSFGQCLAPSNCLPPLNGKYAGQFHQSFAGLVNLSNPVHSQFTSCDAPPQNPGDVAIHSFGSNVTATVAVTNGPTFTMNAPAQVTVKIKKVDQSGNLSTYETEMLQLDIQGGNLDPRTIIRESPAETSAGITTINNTGGGFLINSSFDISTELSLDSGKTWIPSDHPGHMVLSCPCPVCPTLSQWGIIILALLFISTAVWVLMRRRARLSV